MKLMLEKLNSPSANLAIAQWNESRRLALEEAKEKPTAPASLVEELEKLETVEVDDEIGRTYYYYMQQVDSILSRYRPSPKADIVENKDKQL